MVVTGESGLGILTAYLRWVERPRWAALKVVVFIWLSLNIMNRDHGSQWPCQGFRRRDFVVINGSPLHKCWANSIPAEARCVGLYVQVFRCAGVHCFAS